MTGKIKISELKEKLKNFSDDDYLLVDTSGDRLWVMLVSAEKEGLYYKKAEDLFREVAEYDFDDD